MLINRKNGTLIKLLAVIMYVTWAGSVSAGPGLTSKEQVPVQVKFLIQKAGNADSDLERLRFLQKLQEVPGLEPTFRHQLDTLVRSIDKWTNDPDIRVWSPFYPLFSTVGTEDTFRNSPLYPILAFYKARYLVQHTFQKGSLWRNMDRRMERFTQAKKFFEETVQAFPENRIARMYLGEPYPIQTNYTAVPGAPEWAVYQREFLERLTDITLWWVRNRQQEDGSYGGGWGDDVEMWRFWGPVLIAFQHPVLEEAQSLTSNGMLAQDGMEKGYSSSPRDVEHAAEPTADAITPMMFLRPNDPQWKSRSLRLAELMEGVWTGINQKGHLQFKSTYFSADSVILDPPRKACATAYEARAIQPLLLYWQRTGDPEVKELITAWLDGWLSAAMSTERGKPRGVLPTAVHWPDGNIGGLGENWWRPGNYDDNPLYDFPSTISFTMNSLLLGWFMTDQEEYLAPMRAMAKLRFDYLNKYGNNPSNHALKEGSTEWLASHLSMVEDVCAKYRFLTGKKDFDELLKLAGTSNPYAQFRVTHNLGNVTTALRTSAETLRNYFPAYTSEVRWTDRVLRFPAILSEPAIYPEPLSTASDVNIQLLYSLLTGEPSGGGYFPINAVRWKTLPRDIAVLVNSSSYRQFEAELFHFGKTGRQMEAELYLLNQGTYTLSLVEKATGEVLQTQKVQAGDQPTTLSFNLPPQKLCVLTLK